jgi:uncharacterized protein (DUF427 family)
MAQDGGVRVEDSAKWVRVMLGGVFVADSTHAKLVWERPYYPTYYFPAADVRVDLLTDTGEVHHSSSRGDAAVHDVRAGSATAPGAASWLRDSRVPELRDHVRFVWEAMDAWFEEDEEVFVHPRDPYTRVDVLQSSRHVHVEVDGTTVADSRRPRVLFETGLPPRFYLPKTDVRMDLLAPSDHHTECPYKGTASYYHLDVEGTRHENFVWWYPTTTHEAAAIAGYVAFYNEKVDLSVDGVLQDRPRTVFN